VRDFRHLIGGIPQSRRVPPLHPARRSGNLGIEPSERLARLLLLIVGSAGIPVFRATVLSIVLTLVAGPNASMLCKAWCHPAEAAAARCHHEHGGPSATLTGTDGCGNVVLGTAVLVKEEARRGLSSPKAHHTVLVPRYQYAVSTSEAHPGDESGCAWPLAQQPLVAALRI